LTWRLVLHFVLGREGGEVERCFEKQKQKMKSKILSFPSADKLPNLEPLRLRCE